MFEYRYDLREDTEEMLIAVVGNRQACFISDVFRHILGKNVDVEVVYVDNNNTDEHIENLLERCGVIIVQENGFQDRLSKFGIHRTAKVYRIADVSVDFIWPFGGQPHYRNHINSVFNNGPFPATLGDAYLNRKLQAGSACKDLESYVYNSIFSFIDIDRILNLQLEKQYKIDQIVGTNIASYIESHFRDEQIFYNPLWPLPALLLQIMSTIDFGDFCRAKFCDKDLLQLYVERFELPIHPGIMSSFGMKWAKSHSKFNLHPGDSVSFPEYVWRYAAYHEGEDIELGVLFSSQGLHEKAVKRLRVGVSRQFGALSVKAHKALSASLYALGETSLASSAEYRANELLLEETRRSY